MRKVSLSIVALFILLGAFGGSVAAQDLRPLGTDLSTLLNGIGESLLPSMQQSALADDGMGAATMGDSRFYFGLESGVTFASPGLLSVLSESPSPFQLIDVNGLIANLNANSSVTNFLDKVENWKIFPYPNLKLVGGFSPTNGLEFIGTFTILPQGLTNLAAKIAKASDAGIKLNTLSASLRVRGVLLDGTGVLPAASIAIGYAYSNFHAGYTLPDQSQPFAGYNLHYSGTLGLDASMNSVGVDLNISKRFLFMTPFFRISPWYQWAKYTGTMDPFNFSLTDNSGNPVSGVIDPSTPSASITIHSLSFILAGGVEFNLGKFAIIPAGSFDVATKNFNANISSRMQF